MKKSNQKSLGEDPETPDASEPPRPETLRIPGAGLDDAYKVDFSFGPCKIQNKMRRRHLESVSAAPYERCQSIVRIQPQLSGKGVLGHSPKRILVPFVRTKGTPRRRAVQAVTSR